MKKNDGGAAFEMAELTMPKGWRKIKCEIFIDDENNYLIATGEPEELYKNPDVHNCDYMGCGSLSHVIFRALITKPTQADAMIAAREGKDE